MRFSSLLSILLVTPLLTALAAPATPHNSPRRTQSSLPNVGGADLDHANEEIQTRANFKDLIAKSKPILARARQCYEPLDPQKDKSNPPDFELAGNMIAAWCLKEKCSHTMQPYHDAMKSDTISPEAESSDLEKMKTLLEVMPPYVNCLEKFMDRSECHCPKLLVPPAQNGVDHSQSNGSA